MPNRFSPASFSRLLMHEPQIALAALTRLRWLAVVGQIAATAVAVSVLKLELPLLPIGLVIGLTAASNAVAVIQMRRGQLPYGLVQFLLLLDVAALTILLYFTGGPKNPFAVLYLVHVAMAVTVLGSAWTWVIVGTAAACYGLLIRWHVGLSGPVPDWAAAVGHWFSIALVSVLIAAFIGRVERSLQERELELASVRERARKNEQLAGLTTLAAGAAHELNTPLGTIAVVAKELERAGAGHDAEQVREDAQLIRREVDRCREIINRLRFHLDEDLNDVGPVDVLALVRNLRKSIRPAEADRLRVLIGSDVDALPVPGRAVEQALLVLLRNAFDASPADAGVTLSIQRRDGKFRIEIEDRGAGMSDELLRRAGEPFYTTKEPGKGMGLGLFLVRLVAERVGAEFSIQSTVGEGTRCLLEVPDDAGKNRGGPVLPLAASRGETREPVTVAPGHPG